jgi:uncharacterized protein YraI
MKMKTVLRSSLLFVGFLMVFCSSASAPLASENCNVNLRRDPSLSGPIITLLPKGSRLMLVDSTADGDFYHVRTEDDQVGWVSPSM